MRSYSDMSYTTNDFSATVLLGINSPTTNFQWRTFFRRAHDFPVITHADDAETGTRQDFAVTVFHIFKMALTRI